MGLDMQNTLGSISGKGREQWRQVLTSHEIAVCEWMSKGAMEQLGYVAESRFAAAGLLRALLSYPFHLIGMCLVNPRRVWIHCKALLPALWKK